MSKFQHCITLWFLWLCLWLPILSLAFWLCHMPAQFVAQYLYRKTGQLKLCHPDTQSVLSASDCWYPAWYSSSVLLVQCIVLRSWNHWQPVQTCRWWSGLCLLAVEVHLHCLQVTDNRRFDRLVLDTLTPDSQLSSANAMTTSKSMLNSSGESMQPCVTPTTVTNHSVNETKSYFGSEAISLAASSASMREERWWDCFVVSNTSNSNHHATASASSNGQTPLGSIAR